MLFQRKVVTLSQLISNTRKITNWLIYTIQHIMQKAKQQFIAIFATDGKQFKVTTGTQIQLNRRAVKVGEEITFSEVQLLADQEKVATGDPYIPGAFVKAKVLAHVKSKKKIVFKKKRRKGYAVKNGYRNAYTNVEISSIATK